MMRSRTSSPSWIWTIFLDRLSRTWFTSFTVNWICPPASLHEVIEQQGGEITHFLIVRVFAEIQYLGHGGFNVSRWWSIFIAEARPGPQ